MSMGLAAHDAATNCARDGARATVVLKSGREFVGLLEVPGSLNDNENATLHMRVESGGWLTILFREVAAIGATAR